VSDEGKGPRRGDHGAGGGAVDVAILTVIPAELLAARAASGIGDDGREKDEDGGTVYLRGTVRSELAGREYRVVPSCIDGAGSPGVGSRRRTWADCSRGRG
jgi:hypothetical protein